MRRDILTTLMPGFVGTELPGWVRALLEDGLGGVCLFGENIESPEQVATLTAAIYAANPDAVIAIDEEGGDVTRLHYDVGAPYPGNAVLGRIDSEVATTAVARAVGWDLRRVGVNLNFAPDVDVNSNPDNPVIGVRSFGADPALVARHSAAWVTGLQATGVAASIKHFPGHGDTAQDSHLALPSIDGDLDELRDRELVPFRAAIAAGSATVMTSHILIPRVDADNPATFSPRILGELLRGELGFTGVIVSDALDMKGASGITGIPVAAARAITAGCDLLCIGTKNTAPQLESIVAAVAAAVEDGGLSESRLADAAARVRRLASDVRAAAAAAGTPPPAAAEPVVSSVDIVTAIEVSPAAAAAIPQLGERPAVVRINTVANIAVGVSPWGPFAAGLVDDVYAVDEVDQSAVEAIGSATAVVVVGKDNHRYPWVVELVARLRAVHNTVVVVDMGWPSDDRAVADIATFGASRIVGRALLELLHIDHGHNPSAATAQQRTVGEA